MQDYTLARRAMIDSQLRPQGVTDRAVLKAMATVPREDFVPEHAKPFAYVDRSIAVEGGALIAPAPLGRLLTAAAPQAGERALVIGAAPGYAAALLREMGLQVEQRLALEFPGVSEVGGPFEFILIEGAVECIPTALEQALVEGGRIATALITVGTVTRLAIGRKVGDVVGYVRFADSEIPRLGGFIRPLAFTF